MSGLVALPQPVEAPGLGGLDRHSADPAVLRPALRALTQGVDAGSLAWPDLLALLGRYGATDAGWARLAEGHVDAVRILAQAGRAPAAGATYGVWASRSRGTGPVATAAEGGGWRVAGPLRFASGVGVIDRALVSALDAGGEPLLLDLDVAWWAGDPTSWATPAMATSRSWAVTVDALAPAEALVGDPGWYLRRPAFLPGGVGVAAVWHGAAARLARVLAQASAGAPTAPERSVRWGHIATDLVGAGAALQVAGQRLEALLPTGSLTRWDSCAPGAGEEAGALSAQTRAVVALACGRIIEHARALAGPAGLSGDRALAAAVADLELYVAQHPVDAGARGLGEQALAGFRDGLVDGPVDG